MPTNVTPHYQKAEQNYHEADTIEKKINALQKMLSLAPTHKGGESLRSNIKRRIARLKYAHEKETKQKKRRGISIKKEGAAQVVIIGITNSGKSTLLSTVTNARPLIADYKFTTIKPEVGTLDYRGIVIQMIELPAISKNYLEKENGPSYFSMARDSDLIIITSKSEDDLRLVEKELDYAGIVKKNLVIRSIDDSKLKDKIWKKLGLIYVYTKSPGKEKDYPPVALKKKSTVKDLTLKVHKDFLKNFDYAKIWGPSAKHPAMKVGLDHKLKEDDVIELHIK